MIVMVPCENVDITKIIKLFGDLRVMSMILDTKDEDVMHDVIVRFPKMKIKEENNTIEEYFTDEEVRKFKFRS